MLPVILAIAAAAKIAADASKGSAEQRMAENAYRLQQAHLANSDAIARGSLQSNNANTRASMANNDTQFRAGLDLQRKQFSQQEPNAQARQAMYGSLLQRIQPISMSGGNTRLAANMPKMNSIIDAIGPEAREAGGLLSQRGLSGLRSGPSQFTDLPAVSLPDVLNLPPAQIAEFQRAGKLEKILGAIGLAGSAVGTLGDMQSVNGGAASHGMNNAMPTPYSGLDQYGNPADFKLAKGELQPNLPATFLGFGGG